jgi:GNAT superfamily N-acetyltransferase
MLGSCVIEPLADHPQALPELAALFEAEWPQWYRSGRANAMQDLQAYANQGSLPVGFVALHDGAVCGAAVLKAESIPSHAHLSPWAGAGVVKAALRGQGIGLQLLRALEVQAKALRFTHIYCGTSTAGTLLERAGWHVLDRITYEGKALVVYAKAL